MHSSLEDEEYCCSFFFFFFDNYRIKLGRPPIPIHFGPDVLKLKHMYIASALKISLPFLSCTYVIGTRIVILNILTLYLIEMPFNTFANRADPDQTRVLLRLLMEI